MAYQFELKAAVDGLLGVLGIKLSPEERVLMRERCFYAKGTMPSTQQELAGLLGFSQPYVSNLEERLMGKIAAARRRAEKGVASSEQQAEMLVGLFRELRDQAQLAGYSLDQIEQRAAERGDAAA